MMNWYVTRHCHIVVEQVHNNWYVTLHCHIVVEQVHNNWYVTRHCHIVVDHAHNNWYMWLCTAMSLSSMFTTIVYNIYHVKFVRLSSWRQMSFSKHYDALTPVIGANFNFKLNASSIKLKPLYFLLTRILPGVHNPVIDMTTNYPVL